MKKGKLIWIVLLIIIVIGGLANKGKNGNITTTKDTGVSVMVTASPTSKATKKVTPTATPVRYQESEALKSFLFSFKDWNKVTDTQVRKTAEQFGLNCEDQMGWGGTSWTYMITDPSNKDNELDITFARPKKENGKQHFSFFWFLAPDAECSFHYYGTWYGKNITNGQTGYWFSLLEFKSLEEAYDYCVAVASGEK